MGYKYYAVCISNSGKHGKEIDALNINWLGLIEYPYPTTTFLYWMSQNIWQYYCPIILIAPGWPGLPWIWNPVQLSIKIPLQLPVSKTLLKQSHSQVFHNNSQHLNLCLVSRSGLLQEQGFFVEVTEIIAVPQRSSRWTVYKS